MEYLKRNGEAIGKPLLLLGLVLIVVAFALSFGGAQVVYLVGLGLASFSVALGFIAIGTSTKAEERFKQILIDIRDKVELIHYAVEDKFLKSTGQEMVKAVKSDGSREAAQKRLDEDRKRVGYLRGELYKTKEGSWAIAWGGKYPL